MLYRLKQLPPTISDPVFKLRKINEKTFQNVGNVSFVGLWCTEPPTLHAFPRSTVLAILPALKLLLPGLSHSQLPRGVS